MLYPATVHKDGETYIVLFPDIPHAHTNGSSRADALAHAPDALEAALSMLMEKGHDLPSASKPRRGSVTVGLPSVVTTARIALYSALRSSGMRRNRAFSR